MKNLHGGFIGLVLSIIISLFLVGGGTYLYFNKEKSNVSTNIEQENLKSENTDIVSSPSGLLSYSNKVFSNFFPKGWTTEEEVLSSNGCNARVYFVQNSVLKQTLINESTDYLHYLANPGSVFSVSGGIGEQGTVSFENLKKRLSDMEKDGRTIKLSFFQENVVETDHKLNIDNSSPSLTYYFEFPKYNKKGIAKSVVLGGKFPQMVSIYYIAPAKDFSEDVFNSIVSSVKNNLTTNRCDPFETSSVKKDQGIIVKLPADKSWKENNTYTVSWSTDLPSSSYSYFYVQLGSDVPKRTASNPGSYGLWKVDKSKNSLEIKLDYNLINEQINNSHDRNFDQIKNSFFVRVTAYDDKGTSYNQDDKVVASSDSSLFLVERASRQTIDAAEALGSIANITSSVANFRAVAEMYYSNHSESYSGLCKNGFIDATPSRDTSLIVSYILSAQGVYNQSDAGVTCVATKDKYALEVKFKKYVPPNGAYLSGKYSACADSTGVTGDDTKYKIDKANFKCKSVQ